MLAGPALADGMPSRGKIGAPESRVCSTSAEVGVTSDNVFRGLSKSNEEAAIQGGVEFSCGRFYAGVAGASVTAGNGSEFDIYGGFRTSFNKINFDLGFTYYTLPGADDANFFELKASASTAIWQGGTIGGSVFYGFEYLGLNTDVATYEVGFSQALPKVGIFSPTFSATYGYSDFLDFSSLSYSYWNVGVSLGFLDKWSLDLRYHDTDGDGFASLVGPLADERFVATLKYSF
jgi:uncharacterized protein (TIGR02001 family)